MVAPLHVMSPMLEKARRHAITGFFACLIGFALVLALAYWLGPTERLDRNLLDALATGTDTAVNHVAFVGFQVVDFRRPGCSGGCGTRSSPPPLLAEPGGLVLALKALIANPRYQPVPLGTDAYPTEYAFPSGHAAGSLAMSLAFLMVVPPSWQRPTAVAGVAFTAYISLGSWFSTTTIQATSSPVGCSRQPGGSHLWLCHAFSKIGTAPRPDEMEPKSRFLVRSPNPM
jgi:membrane-associated phospholipid phosphatase